MVSSALSILRELDRIIDENAAQLEVRTLCEVGEGRQGFPVQALCLGSASRDAPAIGFFGGVHGLERIGTQVLLSFLGSFLEQLRWDEQLARQLAGVRLVFMPLVNPAGMSRSTRSNANGVDLMRNAPVDSRERVAFLVGGHRLSPSLPWYRGPKQGPMEAESRALCELVRAELLSRPFSIALDCHSGFGLRDRIWFPHAHTRRPFARLAEVHALVARFNELWPEHPYLFEPQSRRYLAHGDLWDFLSAEVESAGRIFIPLTLEMGSWRWVRKSPRQILSRLGMFNPLPPDRLLRVQRNHLVWLNFLCRSAQTYREWLPSGEARARHERSGLSDWFGETA